jgi:hypothetical protein
MVHKTIWHHKRGIWHHKLVHLVDSASKFVNFKGQTIWVLPKVLKHGLGPCHTIHCYCRTLKIYEHDIIIVVYCGELTCIWQLTQCCYNKLMLLPSSTLLQPCHSLPAELLRCWQLAEGCDASNRSVGDARPQQLLRCLAADILCCWQLAQVTRAPDTAFAHSHTDQV